MLKTVNATLGALALVALLPSAAQACNRGAEVCSFTLFNNTSVKLNSFQASPARVNKWEEDILGKRVLNAGGEISVNMSDRRPDCIYDFRFTFADGDIVTRKAINVCKLGRYTLNE
ncbi:MAG: hypothetical protein NTZ14_13745 [Hyphomicrobiales bacterium]|nr:hypothetical protein [Hyphomicrobiales bacterium]